MDDNRNNQQSDKPKTPAPIAHVVGEGGKCWCGQEHEFYWGTCERKAPPHGNMRHRQSPECVNWTGRPEEYFYA